MEEEDVEDEILVEDEQGDEIVALRAQDVESVRFQEKNAVLRKCIICGASWGGSYM